MITVPRLLPIRDIEPARLFSQPCLCCDFVANAASEAAVQHGMDAHARYLNAHADRATDPHFEEQRLNAAIDA